MTREPPQIAVIEKVIYEEGRRHTVKEEVGISGHRGNIMKSDTIRLNKYSGKYKYVNLSSEYILSIDIERNR